MCQILGGTAAGNDAHQRLALRQPCPADRGECHVGCRDELGAAAARQAFELDDGQLGLRADHLSQCLEGIQAAGRGLRHIVKSVRFVDQLHIHMGDEEIGIGALKHDHVCARIIMHRSEKTPDVAHQRDIQHVDRRVVDRDCRHAAILCHTDPGVSRSVHGFPWLAPHGETLSVPHHHGIF